MNELLTFVLAFKISFNCNIALHVYRSMCEVLPNSELVQLNACTSEGFIFFVNQIFFLVPRRVIVLEKEQDDLRA